LQGALGSFAQTPHNFVAKITTYYFLRQLKYFFKKWEPNARIACLIGVEGVIPGAGRFNPGSTA
jgi:hypothetical protein